MDFATRLKELRKEKGITQDEFALDFGVSKGTVSVWERGIRKPEFGTIENLADYFHVSFSYLMGMSDNKFIENPSDEDTAAWSDEEDIDDFIYASKLYWCLSPHSKQIIRGCIAAAYSADKLAGTLEKNRFKVNVEIISGDEDAAEH